MRQVYTSNRTENVDRVVALLAEAGIETTITNRRAYAGHDYKGPSYTEKVDRNTWPQVWITHAEDQPRARALLREAGVEPATRFAEEVAQSRGKSTDSAPAQRRVTFIWRVRTILLAVIVLIVVLNWIGVLHLF